jgi:hypothetical protein
MNEIGGTGTLRRVAAWILAAAAVAGSFFGLMLFWKSPEWAINNANWAGPAWFATVPIGIAACVVSLRRPRVLVPAVAGAVAVLLFTGQWLMYFVRQAGAR